MVTRIAWDRLNGPTRQKIAPTDRMRPPGRAASTMYEAHQYT